MIRLRFAFLGAYIFCGLFIGAQGFLSSPYLSNNSEDYISAREMRVTENVPEIGFKSFKLAQISYE